MLRWILMLLLAPALHALAGTYAGVLEVSGTKLRLVLKFAGGTATLGRPDQSADEFRRSRKPDRPDCLSST